jgi:hypothetical protein
MLATYFFLEDDVISSLYFSIYYVIIILKYKEIYVGQHQPLISYYFIFL